MMNAAELLEQVRVSSGLTQEELARRAGTSRPTLSAYEHGRKSPTVATFARLLSRAGWELAALPQVSFTQQPSAGGRPTWVPDRLPRLDVARALAVVELPLHLNWSAPGRAFDLRSRADRARVYEVVRQEGRPSDILAYVDGALLVDLWDDLVLPRAVRSAWAPLVSPSVKADGERRMSRPPAGSRLSFARFCVLGGWFRAWQETEAAKCRRKPRDSQEHACTV
jgi:transcriptional regulator with XRE-family HTH domain